MKIRLLLTIIIITFIIGLPLNIFGQTAYRVDGNELVKKMRGYEKMLSNKKNTLDDLESALDARSYNGYIMGVLDATSDNYNLPEEVTGEQLTAVITKYLKEHPGQWHKPAYFLVARALATEFGFSKSMLEKLEKERLKDK